MNDTDEAQEIRGMAMASQLNQVLPWARALFARGTRDGVDFHQEVLVVLSDASPFLTTAPPSVRESLLALMDKIGPGLHFGFLDRARFSRRIEDAGLGDLADEIRNAQPGEVPSFLAVIGGMGSLPLPRVIFENDAPLGCSWRHGMLMFFDMSTRWIERLDPRNQKAS
jgi:hypothetical protein